MESPNSEYERLAIKVTELAKALLLADNHFLSAAVGRLKLVCTVLPDQYSCNGETLGIDATALRFMAEGNLLTKAAASKLATQCSAEGRVEAAAVLMEATAGKSSSLEL